MPARQRNDTWAPYEALSVGELREVLDRPIVSVGSAKYTKWPQFKTRTLLTATPVAFSWSWQLR